MAKKEIVVERETFKMKGSEKEYFSYFVKGKVRCKEVKAGVTPPDKGGYVVLDIVFGNEMSAELTVKPFEMKDNNGNVIKGNSYGVKSVDEKGKVYECSIKPARSSDKSLLAMLLDD